MKYNKKLFKTNSYNCKKLDTLSTKNLSLINFEMNNILIKKVIKYYQLCLIEAVDSIERS
jgi:hypothetical protein